MRTSRRVQALALIGLLGTAPAYAEWSLNVQIERFKWNEELSPPPDVDEAGGRAGVGWSWQMDGDTGLRWRYRGGLYAGSVKYQGQTSTGTPAQATSDYAGIVNELHALYRRAPDAWLQVVAGVGFDYWQRTLPFTSQREDWSVWFTRFGVETGTWTKRGFFAGAGAKYPIYATEDSHFMDAGFDQNPELRPGRELSAYAELGYRLSPSWKFTGYYDSYRFAQSPNVQLTRGGTGFIAWQPRSAQDVVGLRIDYYF
ncbi:MAG TPA: hypothetical protein VFJ70_23660 [Burkholderiales bacterium]|nr:hypothetical protein [Burkholderiales bacterium]